MNWDFVAGIVVGIGYMTLVNIWNMRTYRIAMWTAFDAYNENVKKLLEAAKNEAIHSR